MPSPQPKAPSKGLPNPYGGGLPNPYEYKANIQVPPVMFDEQVKAEQKKTAPKFHNPHSIKRPQAKGNNAPKKPARPVMTFNNAVDVSPATGTEQKHSLEYYMSTADDDAEINSARIERNHEIKQKAKEAKRNAKKYGTWYPERNHHPSRYTNVTAYRSLGSYEEIKLDFRNFLRKSRGDHQRNHSDGTSPPVEPRPGSRSGPKSPTNPTRLPNEETADEAFARRTRLSSTPQAGVLPPPPPPPFPPSLSENAVPPPPPPPPPPPAAPSYSHTISSAPVYYTQAEVRKRVDDAPSSREAHEERPAKKPKLSFGARMLAKMGHVEGEGLGKNSDGITTHLEAVKRKGQGKFNDEGNIDRVKSATVFDIRGGERKVVPEESKFGQSSRVIVAWGCCDGVDLAADADRNDGGIRQKMGEVFQAKFGSIERIHYNATITSPPVYVQFVDGLSALNAVNRFEEGYQFEDRKIEARFYPEAKFQEQIFDL